MTPGRNDSTTTSAVPSRRSNTSRPSVGLQVDGERAPAAVPHAVPVVRAERIAAGRLDLDHVGALLGEQQHAERTGDSPREVEDADTVERTGHDYGSLTAARPPARLRCVRTA